MLRTRVIPCLLLKNSGFYKTTEFKDPVYLGDPMNILRIFNDKEVDEIVIYDITATLEGKTPNYELLREMAGECFMPLAYGGGIHSMRIMEKLFDLGMEKVCLNTAAVETPNLLRDAAAEYGASSVMVCLDVKKKWLGGYEVYTHAGSRRTGLDPAAAASAAEELGAGEIVVNAIHRDGTMKGYDIELIRAVSSAVSVPVIARGGAGSVDDLRAAVVEGGASAVGAGAMFVFHGPRRGVLIHVPERREMEEILP